MNKPYWAWCDGCRALRSCKRVRHLVIGFKGNYCHSCRTKARNRIREAMERQRVK